MNMILGGVEIDMDKVLEGATARIVEDAESMVWKYGEDGNLMEGIDLLFEGEVWNVLVRELRKAVAVGEEEYAVERAMAELMKRGVGKEFGKIWFRKNCFIVEMRNCRFKIRKLEKGFAAAPRTVGGFRLTDMGWCSPSMFAQLLLDFDGIVSSLEGTVGQVVEKIRGVLLEYEQKKRMVELQQQTLAVLIEEYLTPLGITCTPNIDGDRIRLKLVRRQSGVIDTTIDKVAEILANRELVDNTLKTEIKETIPDPFLFFM